MAPAAFCQVDPAEESPPRAWRVRVLTLRRLRQLRSLSGTQVSYHSRRPRFLTRSRGRAPPAPECAPAFLRAFARARRAGRVCARVRARICRGVSGTVTWAVWDLQGADLRQLTVSPRAAWCLLRWPNFAYQVVCVCARARACMSPHSQSVIFRDLTRWRSREWRGPKHVPRGEGQGGSWPQRAWRWGGDTVRLATHLDSPGLKRIEGMMGATRHLPPEPGVWIQTSPGRPRPEAANVWEPGLSLDSGSPRPWRHLPSECSAAPCSRSANPPCPSPEPPHPCGPLSPNSLSPSLLECASPPTLTGRLKLRPCR